MIYLDKYGMMKAEDKTGNVIDISRGAKFRATDRNGRTFTYYCTGEYSYYEVILLNMDQDPGYNETRVTSSWFSERDIEPLE